MSEARKTTGKRGDPFRVAGFYGEINPRLAPLDVEKAVHGLTDPGAARETVHWGRNYLYALPVETRSGLLEVVVKQFRNQGLVARWKRRHAGSKATRSWLGAWALVDAGVRTPDPVMLIESERPEGPSFFVSARLQGFVESRYYFRALIAGNEQELFPDIDRDELISALGTACRKVHDGGIWHRDISIGNLLVSEEHGRPAISIIDLNRARLGARLGLWRRTRDLCRLPFPRPAHRELFLSSYWRGPISRRGLRYWLFWLLQQGFLLKNRIKAAIRRPLRTLRDAVRERRPHAHIPEAPTGAAARDKTVWDYLSDQPHQHATRGERARVRMADIGSHANAAATLLRAAPRIWQRYRNLEREAFRHRLAWDGVGIAVRPSPEAPDALLEALAESAAEKVLLRLHPWENDHSAELELAAELSGRGYELAFALPQNRELVCDLDRWQTVVEDLAESFSPYGRHFQVGQAVNRSKWGVWTYQEYLELAARACDVLRRDRDVIIMGPAVIDFELQATAAIVNLRREGVYFDVLSSLLYVDRRGAPENPQMGFDSPQKAALVKAIAETASLCSGRCWITEVNWPLWEGPHSPAGRTVSVDEETQADYLSRYYLLMLASGMTERVYWWQLAARGYGLAEPLDGGALRRRPSFHALAALGRELGGGWFEKMLPSSPGTRLMLFSDRNGAEVVVGWVVDEPSLVELPRPASSARDRSGQEIRLADAQRVEIARGPRFFTLET